MTIGDLLAWIAGARIAYVLLGILTAAVVLFAYGAWGFFFEEQYEKERAKRRKEKEARRGL